MVTGATGFVGEALCSALRERGHLVRAAVHSAGWASSIDCPVTVLRGGVGAQTDWAVALSGMDCVIHCAARAHVTRETEANPLAAYRSVNVAGTRRLAEQAAVLGVKRLIFLSTIGVLGVHTNGRRPFTIADQPNPIDDYAISKWEAEQTLWAVSKHNNLEVVVIRLPLAYGPGVKGNMLRLLRVVASGMPLPLGAAYHPRSFLGISNLVDLLERSVTHPAAAGKTFLASDGKNLCVSELIQLMAEGMSSSTRLFRVPLSLIKAGSFLLGMRGEIDRLVGALRVNSEYTERCLEWRPPVAVDHGIREMAEWYARMQNVK